MIGYPKWFSKKLITISIFVLLATGIVLIPSAILFRFEIDLNYVLPSDLRVFSAVLHVFFSYIVLVIIGALLFIHVRFGLRKKKKIKSGIVMLFVFFILCITGIGLLYFSHEVLIKASSIGHIFLGLLFTILYFIHVQLKGSEKN